MEILEPATKGDLREIELKLQKEIIQNSNKTILWIVGIISGYGAFLLGIIAKGFHWW